MYNWDLEIYNKEKDLCKTYDVGVPKEKVPEYWKVDGQILEEGKDFRLDVEYENYEPNNRKTRTVAIPLKENKEEEVKHPEDFYVECNVCKATFKKLGRFNSMLWLYSLFGKRRWNSIKRVYSFCISK